jgi:hypothetical protein
MIDSANGIRAARAKGGENLVRAEPNAGGQGQVRWLT